MKTNEYLKTIDFDPLDAGDVVRVLKETLEQDFECPEMTLFCIGKILDKNKEAYINILKNKTTEKQRKIDDLTSEVSKLKKQNEKAQNIELVPAKKKVVIVKKKVTNG